MKLYLELVSPRKHPTMDNEYYDAVVGEVSEPYCRADGSWWVNVDGNTTGCALRLDDISAGYVVMQNEAGLTMDDVTWSKGTLVLI